MVFPGFPGATRVAAMARLMALDGLLEAAHGAPDGDSQGACHGVTGVREEWSDGVIE